MSTGFYDILSTALLSLQAKPDAENPEVLLSPDEQQLGTEDYHILRIRTPKNDEDNIDASPSGNRIGGSVVPGPHDYLRVAVRKHDESRVDELAARLVETLPEVPLSVGFVTEGERLAYCETASWEAAHNLAWQHWRRGSRCEERRVCQVA